MRATREEQTLRGTLSLAIRFVNVLVRPHEKHSIHQLTMHYRLTTPSLSFIQLKAPSRAVAPALSPHHTGLTPCAHHNQRLCFNSAAISRTQPQRSQALNKHPLLILASTHRPPCLLGRGSSLNRMITPVHSPQPRHPPGGGRIWIRHRGNPKNVKSKV